MKVFYSNEFLKQAKSLSEKNQEILDVSLRILLKDPFYPTLHTKHLKGELRHFLSFRITRELRVIFMFESSDKIRLISIGHRKDIYR